MCITKLPPPNPNPNPNQVLCFERAAVTGTFHKSKRGGATFSLVEQREAITAIQAANPNPNPNSTYP